jgi:hypothetical protein
VFGATGRLLVVLGGVLLLTGLIFLFLARLPGGGRIPGNVVIQRENFALFMPLGAMIPISVLMTLILNVVMRLRR